MKRIGYLLIALGFLGGALAAVVEEATVPWGYFVTALGAGVAGVVLVRLTTRRAVRAEGRLHLGLQQLEASLARLVAGIRGLSDGEAVPDPLEVRQHIDERLRSDLLLFAEARESLAHVFGLQAYADVMSHFAAGERYLNRVWSASADGYIDEVGAYLAQAEAQFAQAQARIEALKG